MLTEHAACITWNARYQRTWLQPKRTHSCTGEKKHHAVEPGPWGQHSYALVLAQPSYPSTSAHLHITIYTTPSTLYRQNNTIYTTSSNTTSAIHTHTHMPSTLHHQHNIINTTSSTHHHLHNTIYTTPSTQHHPHSTIYTTSSHTGRCSTWSTAILPLLPHSC